MINKVMPIFGRRIISSSGDNRFIMTVKSDNSGTSASNQFAIPTSGGGYNYSIETSDGYTASGLTGNHTITFPSGAGTHKVFISGFFPRVRFVGVGDCLKVLSVDNWGIYGILTNGQNPTNQDAAFWGCTNMDVLATDAPNFKNTLGIGFTSNIDTFFRLNSSLINLNKSIENWDTSSITSANVTFQNTNIDISFQNWDITNVVSFNSFLAGVTLSTANYDSTLIGWEATLQASFPNGVGYTPTISISFGSSQYTLGGSAETARTSLINNFGWTIADGGGI